MRGFAHCFFQKSRLSFFDHQPAQLFGRRLAVKFVRDLFVDGRTRRYEALRLPLSSDGGTIDMILSATEYLS